MYRAACASLWHLRLRHATCTSIAPTGTVSLIAGTSAGIEPLFALAYRRRALDGQTLMELNPIFVQVAQREGFYSEELVRALYRQGSLTHLPDAPQRPSGFSRRRWILRQRIICAFRPPSRNTWIMRCPKRSTCLERPRRTTLLPSQKLNGLDH